VVGGQFLLELHQNDRKQTNKKSLIDGIANHTWGLRVDVS